MATQKTTRIGMIGYGLIGSAVREMIESDENNGMEVVFIHDAEASRLADLPEGLALGDLSQFEDRGADLVVEMAHPAVTRNWGTKILEKTNYMFISVTALADEALEKAIEETALKHCTRAFVPHGGVVGMDALLENRDVWETVDVIMKKPPKNVDCAAAGVDPDSITEETCLYDGPTRGICPIFPRNVNTHAAIAYAGIGFDRTHSVLLVNPEWDTAVVAIEAKGPGIELKVERIEGITGVTGASTPASIHNTVQMIGSTGPGIHLR
ncbi:MAG: aspartate dehydrogenase domain-containing protein [Candidatus Latescibacterota bacterium]|nr:aspartate dehydrogenase domain-containing protein [Candidatus Latescibacterota bacterium]